MIFQSLETIGRRSLEFWISPLASPLAQRSTPRPSCWPTSRRRLRAASGWGCFSIFNFHFNFKVDVCSRDDRHHHWLCQAHPQQYAFRGYHFVHYISYLQFFNNIMFKIQGWRFHGALAWPRCNSGYPAFRKVPCAFLSTENKKGINKSCWLNVLQSLCLFQNHLITLFTLLTLLPPLTLFKSFGAKRLLCLIQFLRTGFP